MRHAFNIAWFIALSAAATEESHETAYGLSSPAQTEAQYGTDDDAPTPRSDKPPNGKDRQQKAGADSSEAARSPRTVVVVSKDNPVESLTVSELRRVFLRQKVQWPNGWTITVFERPIKDPLRQRFSQVFFKKNPEDLHEYWMNLQLTRGLNPPKVLRSALLVKQYLQRVKGGVGYIFEHEVDDTVKTIEITDADLPQNQG